MRKEKKTCHLECMYVLTVEGWRDVFKNKEKCKNVKENNISKTNLCKKEELSIIKGNRIEIDGKWYSISDLQNPDTDLLEESTEDNDEYLIYKIIKILGKNLSRTGKATSPNSVGKTRR